VTNFKSGSGNLDFDGDGDDDPSAASSTGGDGAPDEGTDSSPAESADHGPVESDPDRPADGPTVTTDAPDAERYPYFVRRNNVGDERDTRLEIHVREKVAEGEAQFRHALAAELGASDVSKTDAREFALLAAFRHPERVAELMREEGFDSLG
jgi:hypothetical protein